MQEHLSNSGSEERRIYLRILISIFQKQIRPKKYKLIQNKSLIFVIISVNLDLKTCRKI